MFLKGFEDKFVWNVEKTGAQRPFRILQKRGVIVDAENFIPVTSTYPEHPLSKVLPKAINQQQLKDQRRDAYRLDVYEKTKNFEEFTSKVKPMVVSRIPDEGYVENPKYTSIKQKHANQKIQERQ